MKQKTIIDTLHIQLSDRHVQFFQTSRYRLDNDKFCPKINRHLKFCSNTLIKHLNSLINENDIDIKELCKNGLFHTIRGDTTNYLISSHDFECKIIRRYNIKEKVINNMLYAINLIDSNTLNPPAAGTGS